MVGNEVSNGSGIVGMVIGVGEGL